MLLSLFMNGKLPRLIFLELLKGLIIRIAIKLSSGRLV